MSPSRVTFPRDVEYLEGGSGKACGLVAAGSKPAAIRFRYKFYPYGEERAGGATGVITRWRVPAPSVRSKKIPDSPPLVLARDAQFHICSTTGEQGPWALSMTDAVPYEPIGCIHESVQARVVLLHAEVGEIVALTTGKER